MNVRDKIAGIVAAFCPGVDCESCTTLVDDHYLGSLSMVALIAELEDSFDIEIPPVEIVADNFNSIDMISVLVTRLSQEDVF